MPLNHRVWVDQAVRKIEADYLRSADTHLMPIQLAHPLHHPNIDIYFKDESTHPTGSLKHRLARSLFLYALCNGWIKKDSTIVEASSGSTAISEAYFARLLGLPFIAVVPQATAQYKCDLIRFYGGQVHFVEQANQVHQVATTLAQEAGGHFMNQFLYAERATDWRGSNNIAESVFAQMRGERFPIPTWVVVGAGTGGTSATFGRFVRYQRYATQVAVVDPEFSVFAPYHASGDVTLKSERGSRIEGIGRPCVEASFIRTAVDRILPILDLDSIAAMRILSSWLGRHVGPSTGTNLMGVLRLSQEMAENNQQGSIVTLLCDAGNRYAHLYDDDWVEKNFGQGLQERIQKILSGI
jgi:cysteine synthase A